MRYAKKYLGIDYGTKRIGLAIGDSRTKTAVVFGVVNNAQAIKEIIERENINVIVVGAPYSVANVNYELPENWQKFLAELNAALPGVEIILENERLSSKYAVSLAGDKKTKAGRDEIAAVSILQGYLDKQ